MDKETTPGITVIFGKRLTGKTTKAKEIIKYSANPEQKIYVAIPEAHIEEYKKTAEFPFDTHVYDLSGTLKMGGVSDMMKTFIQNGLREQEGTRYVIIDNGHFLENFPDLTIFSQIYNVRFIVTYQDIFSLFDLDCADIVYGMSLSTERDRRGLKLRLGLDMDDTVTYFKFKK